MTRKRRLRPEEAELWGQVARTADPLPKRDIGQSPSLHSVEPPATPAPSAESLPTFEMTGPKTGHFPTYVPPQSTSEQLRNAPVHMDRKAFGRLKRGKLLPEAKLDLHGLTLDQAHPRLTRFILTSQAQGMRLVLVITGKGQREDPYDPMPRRRGVLKTQVPQWLRLSPLAQAVLQVSEAHQKHGGAGAYYVYLRRLR